MKLYYCSTNYEREADVCGGWELNAGIDFLEYRPSEVAAAVAIYVAGESKALDHTEKAITVLIQHVDLKKVHK